MWLNRSISISELNALLTGEVIYGRYNLSTEKQSTCDKDNMFSFYIADYWWIDSSHRFSIIVDIPDNRLSYGLGTYYASKSFEKTHIWSGRRGKVEYQVLEYYCESYSINDVLFISGLDSFNKSYQKYYSQKLSEYGVRIMLSPLVKQSGDYVKYTAEILNIESISPSEDFVNGFGYYKLTLKFYLNDGEVVRDNILWLNLNDINNSNVDVYVTKKTHDGCFIDIFKCMK